MKRLIITQTAALLGLLCTAANGYALEQCEIQFNNGSRLELPVARSQVEKAKGLTENQNPAPGMLFVWDAPIFKSIWMRDTPAPLTAAFIGPDGLVQSVQDMTPNTDTPHYSMRPFISIIEVPRGKLTELGVERGSYVVRSTCFQLAAIGK